MITYGDVQYEPVRTKIYQFTSSVIAMTSGDSSAQFAICVAVHNRVRTLNNPTVETIAEIYAEEYASFRRKRNERRFLTPLGLDCFNLHRQGMNRDQVDQLTSLLVSTPLGDEVIVTGHDYLGGHVYIIADPGEAICMDPTGWGAIGSGRWHADSFFMIESYTKFKTFEEALLLTYQAKKRADVAPGVGPKYTDLFFIANEGFRYIYQNSSLYAGLDRVYKELHEDEQKTQSKAREAVQKLIENEANKNVQPPEIAKEITAEPSTESSDTENASSSDESAGV